MKALLIQNCAVEDFGLYADALDDPVLVRAFEDARLPALDEWDVAFVGGTPTPATEFETVYPEEWDYLNRAVAAQKPIFGICCGGQVLARILGHGVTRLPVMQIGCFTTRITQPDALFDGFPDEFPAFQWHADTFDAPPIAKDDTGPQAFREGPIAGVIFHLEVDAAGVARWTEAYAHETDRPADEVVAECARHEEEMADLARRIVANFLALAD